MSLVAHFDPGLPGVPVNPEPDAPFGVGGVERVLDHMTDHTFQPLLMTTGEDPIAQVEFDPASARGNP